MVLVCRVPLPEMLTPHTGLAPPCCLLASLIHGPYVCTYHCTRVAGRTFSGCVRWCLRVSWRWCWTRTASWAWAQYQRLWTCCSRAPAAARWWCSSAAACQTAPQGRGCDGRGSMCSCLMQWRSGEQGLQYAGGTSHVVLLRKFACMLQSCIVIDYLVWPQVELCHWLLRLVLPVTLAVAQIHVLLAIPLRTQSVSTATPGTTPVKVQHRVLRTQWVEPR